MKRSLSLFLSLIFMLFILAGCKSSPLVSLESEKILYGQVIDVLDGDTIKLKCDWHIYKVRLAGIDAPEKKQSYGMKSKVFLTRLIGDKNVRVDVKSTDQYGRYVGKIYLHDTDINAEMLRSGYAWHYKLYDSNPKYEQLMLDAQKAQRGLWQDAHPTPPWNFRHDS